MYSDQTPVGGTLVLGSSGRLLTLLDDILLREPAAAPIGAAQILDCLACTTIRRPDACELCSLGGRACRYDGRQRIMAGISVPPTPGSPAIAAIIARAPDLDSLLRDEGTDALVTMLSLILKEFPDQFDSLLDMARMARAIAQRIGLPPAITRAVTAAALLQDLGLMLVLARAEAGRPPSWDIPPGRTGRARLTDRLLEAAGTPPLVRAIVAASIAVDGHEAGDMHARPGRVVAVARHIDERLNGPSDARPTTAAEVAAGLRRTAATDRDSAVLNAAADLVDAL